MSYLFLQLQGPLQRALGHSFALLRCTVVLFPGCQRSTMIFQNFVTFCKYLMDELDSYVIESLTVHFSSISVGHSYLQISQGCTIAFALLFWSVELIPGASTCSFYHNSLHFTGQGSQLGILPATEYIYFSSASRIVI